MEKIMTKRRSVGNAVADQRNANKGTRGTNITYDKVHGNRGKQIQNNLKKK
jgi:hypothetical protein